MMIREKKSYDLIVNIDDKMGKDQMMSVVKRAAGRVGLYVSHIGGFSPNKYPKSVHWHFKRNKKEPGLIDATFWKEGAKFWLTVRNKEPQWAHDTAPHLQKALQDELAQFYA